MDKTQPTFEVMAHCCEWYLLRDQLGNIYMNCRVPAGIYDISRCLRITEADLQDPRKKAQAKAWDVKIVPQFDSQVSRALIETVNHYAITLAPYGNSYIPDYVEQDEQVLLNITRAIYKYLGIETNK